MILDKDSKLNFSEEEYIKSRIKHYEQNFNKRLSTACAKDDWKKLCELLNFPIVKNTP